MNAVLSRLRLRHSVFFVFAVVSVLPIALLVLISSVSASTDVTRTSYITRLNSPRGLMINADGNLVIAEQGPVQTTVACSKR